MATPDARTTERDGAGNIFLFYRDTDLYVSGSASKIGIS